MLNKSMNIRSVLEKAAELEIEGAGSALLDFKVMDTAMLELNELSDEINQAAQDEQEDGRNG